MSTPAEDHLICSSLARLIADLDRVLTLTEQSMTTCPNNACQSFQLLRCLHVSLGDCRAQLIALIRQRGGAELIENPLDHLASVATPPSSPLPHTKARCLLDDAVNIAREGSELIQTILTDIAADEIMKALESLTVVYGDYVTPD